MSVKSIEGLRIMGIDPGLTRCGLSVVQAGRGRSVIPVAVGVVRTPVDAAIEKRLLELSKAVNEWMDEYRPDVVAIERIFERGNVSTVMNTAHGVGVLMLAAAQRDLSCYLYTPSEVKKAISGNGRADKKQMTAMITRILGLNEAPKPADAADALALAVCHCWRAPMILAQQENQVRAQSLMRHHNGVLGKAKQQALQRAADIAPSDAELRSLIQQQTRPRGAWRR
ncbi:crossover junction endodeoxyribonuclease RuvC [Corynebacterium sp. ES2794-CONJ1]|uniref:crossover junction endodeoxyribonuclease RuvC n=1 Tax=unclassified Corynebacterium TaxID=2624378 RepID=UPI002167786D|nr:MULTISPECIES: crossover junction endodeoxyribonuclease RuvC [unclassified Corynebacterium]MCS4489223.1 crossover junction endodeoxyribonuclease RuvC [Corynebacterium sp. ES2775-CONJ]MCS4491036.1 crossover junction endodeoxyribonuclease RuvC [Corynebacterium sp. ES2715-CONJ3]MCS4531083.1 crossover junction endodeoxyribonuclease RuvC [Corynebacterium sp. ES2730-CONJ]MCU9518450.1 crossover junction endodeoxyribonuclease RuvC [Corynebacterium sp. ES2794-CONJ1]